MISIINFTPEFGNINEKLLKDLIRKITKKEKINAKINLSIAFVSASEIKKLNQSYRKKNKPTDVLSFGEINPFSFSQEDFFEPQIVVCLEEVKKNAEESKEPFEKEIIRVLIHALLHLLGEEHEKNILAAKKMFQKQKDYLSNLKSFNVLN